MKNLGTPPLKIGGWLIVVAVILFLNLLYLLIDIVFIMVEIFKAPVVSFLTVENLLYLIVTLFGTFVTVCFIKKWKYFKNVFIGLLAYVVLYNVFIIIIARGFTLSIAQVVISALFVLYMVFSRRVKMTFVYNWDKTIDKESLYYKNYSEKH